MFVYIMFVYIIVQNVLDSVKYSLIAWNGYGILFFVYFGLAPPIFGPFFGL